jgi:hypothetical protein
MAPSRDEAAKADLDSHWSRPTVGRFKAAGESLRGARDRVLAGSARIAELLMGRQRYAGDDDADIVHAAHL